MNVPIQNGIPILTNSGVIAFDALNDIISISRTGMAASTFPWDTKIEVVEGLKNKNALIRKDGIIEPNTNFTDSEWIGFIGEDLDPYRDLNAGGPQRHPHAPLLSEIENANATSNLKIGVYRMNTTNRRGNSWTNGSPDITRHIVIEEDYTETSPLRVQELTIQTNSKLTIQDNLLVVSEDINLVDATSELRLAGNSQLIQTHTENSKVSGAGSLFIDQDSPIESTYRYNYMSSPVTSSGNTFVISVRTNGSIP